MIERAGNTFCIGGAVGEIVDYAVMMRRLLSWRKMDVMLVAGKVESTHIVSLAKLVAPFHLSVEIIRYHYSSVKWWQLLMTFARSPGL